MAAVMDDPLEQLSSITPDLYSNISCGYCGNHSGNFSYEAIAIDLTANFYQKLLDRGWRRSGSSLYKPDLRASCCPPYTIRVDSHAYHPSKSQRQALNRFNYHIIGKRYLKAAVRLFPRTREQARKRKQEYEIVERIHESETGQQKPSLEHDHSLTVTLEENNFTEEKFSLYENYQRAVHNESPTTITRENFTRFLCTSPIRNGQINTKDGNQQIGSYHQCYRIDGKLIAVAVLDLLPQCISSVYFLYHDSVGEFELGKLSAMREIALAKEKGYRWWYPGFYIHDCIKMRYKAKFSPLYILSPESYQWQLFTKDIKDQFSLSKYLSLASGVNEVDNINSNIISSTSSTRITNTAVDQTLSEEDDTRRPLYDRDIPGILTREHLLAGVSLGDIRVKIHYKEIPAREIEDWSTSSMDSCYSIKGIIAQMASAVGPELCKEMILDLQYCDEDDDYEYGCM